MGTFLTGWEVMMRGGKQAKREIALASEAGADMVESNTFGAIKHVLAEYGLQAKMPRLTLVRDMGLLFLPDRQFTVVHAHSVFSHSPIEVIDECLRTVARIMAPDGFFDFTFDRTEGTEHHVLREDFYYRTETLVAVAAKHGLQAQFMDDWELLPHEQSKLRVTHRR